MWWITVGLIMVGILLMLVEMLLVPGVGVAGIFSLAALAAACWYSFACIGYSEGWWKTEVTSRVNEESSLVKAGDRGVAQTRLAPMGTGRFDAVSCEVKSADNTMVGAGTPIEVVAVENNQVIVKPIEKQ